jgi:hypothetical protein
MAEGCPSQYNLPYGGAGRLPSGAPTSLAVALFAVWVACARTSHSISAGAAGPRRVACIDRREGALSKWSRASGRLRPTLALRGGAEGNDSDLSLDHSGTTASQDMSVLEATRGASMQSEGDDDTQMFRAQIVRLMVQAMEDYGFPESARSLERESGVALHDSTALEALTLQASICSGDWARVTSILERTRWVDDRARFTAYRQMCLGLLHAEKVEQAACFLEDKLQPLALTLPRAYSQEVGRLRTHLFSSRQNLPAMASSSSRTDLAVRNSEIPTLPPALPAFRCCCCCSGCLSITDRGLGSIDGGGERLERMTGTADVGDTAGQGDEDGTGRCRAAK